MSVLLSSNGSKIDDMLPGISLCPCALDIETTGFSRYFDRICVLSVATEHKYWIVQYPDRSLLESVLKYANCIVGHNLNFDVLFIQEKIGKKILPKRIFDTMAAAQILENRKRGEKGTFTLKGVAKRYLGIDVDKGEQRSDWSGNLTESQIKYCVRDVMIPLELYKTMYRIANPWHRVRLEAEMNRILAKWNK